MAKLAVATTKDSNYGHSIISLKVHKIENFFGSEFEFYTISLLVMLKF